MSIVLGYDESPGAQRALEYATDLAGLLDDTLVLVYGVDPPGRVGEEYTEHSAALSDRGRTILEEAEEAARQRGIRTVVELVEDKPAPALVAAAEKHDARLIVVGTYAESPMRGAILGSTPHKLLHLSSRPVLCVPARVDQPE